MDLSVRRSSVALRDDLSWLGSAHGTQATQTITLDATTFRNVEGTQSDGGSLISGLPLMKTTVEDGVQLYGLWLDNDATPNELAGFLYTGTQLHPDATRVGAAILEHGRVIVENLPVPVDAAGQASASGRFIFA